MSRNAHIELEWGGQLRLFRLDIEAIESLQEKCDAGPGEIGQRLAATSQLRNWKGGAVAALASGLMGTWRVQDMRETIRQGLLGGARHEGHPMSRHDAEKLCKEYIDKDPAFDNVQTALGVIMAWLFGTGDEQPAGERSSELGTTGSPASPMESSVSAETESTPSAQPAASLPSKSAECPSGSTAPQSAATSKPTARKTRPKA